MRLFCANRHAAAPRRLQLLVTLALAALTLSLVPAFPTESASAATTPAVTATAARNYYVDCRKKSNGVGTAASPWNTTKSVKQHGAFVAGDKILFARGTTCVGQVQPAGSGTKGQPIVIGAYGKGAKPIIHGRGTPSGTGTITLANQRYWTIQDLRLTNRTKASTSKSYRTGLLVLNDHGGKLQGITAQRLRIDNVVSNLGGTRANGGIAVLTFGTKGDGFSGLRIMHNSIDHVGRTGIIVSNQEYPKGADTDVRIGYNKVTWAKGDGILMLGTKGGRIDHNVAAYGSNLKGCKNCGRNGGPSTANAGIWPTRSSNVVMEYNEVYGTHMDHGDGEAFDLDASTKNITVQYNYAHDNEGGALMFCGGVSDSTVRYNIFENNGKAAITFTCYKAPKNIKIYNNTIYSKRTASVVRTLHGKGGSGISFLNNIVYTWGPSKYSWPSKPRTAGNTFIGYHSSSEPGGTGTSWTGPGLRDPGTAGKGRASTSVYKYIKASAALHGVAIPKSANRDYFGNKVNTKSPLRGAQGGK